MAMKHILKQFVGWVTSFKHNEFEKAALRLALWHSLGIFVVLAVSSVLIITLYSSNGIKYTIGLSPEPVHSEFSGYELREHLIEVVVLVDFMTLLVGMFFSYLDARRTLRPIEIMYQKQEQFMGDVAHELRTPLTVMKAGTESLLRHERGVGEYVSYLTEAHEEIDRMTGLVNNLLFLLKNKEISKVKFEAVDMTNIIATQVRTFLPYATLHNVAIISSQSSAVVVNGVSESLHRLVQNLLKNAIDYNIPQGKVTITLERIGRQAILTVADTGVGISQTEQGKVFDRFYRVDSSRVATDHTGSGLGLSIVKAIVEEHKGTIDFLSKKGLGTTVIVSFPVL